MGALGRGLQGMTAGAALLLATGVVQVGNMQKPVSCDVSTGCSDLMPTPDTSEAIKKLTMATAMSIYTVLNASGTEQRFFDNSSRGRCRPNRRLRRPEPPVGPVEKQLRSVKKQGLQVLTAKQVIAQSYSSTHGLAGFFKNIIANLKLKSSQEAVYLLEDLMEWMASGGKCLSPNLREFFESIPSLKYLYKNIFRL